MFVARLLGRVLSLLQVKKLCFLERLLGMMVSCQDVIQWSQFHAYPLQKFLLPLQFKLVQQPRSLIQALHWWMESSRFRGGGSITGTEENANNTGCQSLGALHRRE